MIIEKEINAYENKIREDIATALENANLPLNNKTIFFTTKFMKQALDKGINVDAKDVMLAVSNELHKETK